MELRDAPFASAGRVSLSVSQNASEEATALGNGVGSRQMIRFPPRKADKEDVGEGERWSGPVLWR